MHRRTLLAADCSLCSSTDAEDSAPVGVDRGLLRVNQAVADPTVESECTPARAGGRSPGMLCRLRAQMGVQSKVLSEHRVSNGPSGDDDDPWWHRGTGSGSGSGGSRSGGGDAAAATAAPAAASIGAAAGDTCSEQDGNTTPRAQMMGGGGGGGGGGGSGDGCPDSGYVTPPPCLSGKTPLGGMGLTDSPKTPWGTFGLNTPQRSVIGTPPPRKRAVSLKSSEKRVPSCPVKILDAPGIVGSVRHNQLLDWAGPHLSVALGSTVYVRSSQTGVVHEVAELPEPVSSLRFAGASSVLLWALNGSTVSCVDVARMETLAAALRCPDAASCMSQGSSVLAAGLESGGTSIFDTRNHGRIEQTTLHHAGEVSGIEWSPDQRHLATCAADGFVAVWCLRQRRVLWRFNMGGPATDLAWSTQATGHLAATGGPGRATIAVFNTVQGRPVHSTAVGCETNGVLWDTDEIMTCHGELVADDLQYPSSMIGPQAARVTCNVWHASSAGLQLHGSLAGHHEAVHHMTMSPDKQLLVSASLDETVRFWEYGPPKPRHTRRTRSFEESLLQIR
eukprot:Rhum_TRINITY_DN10795_c0_g1::Rhum_TRINITY_DN10795_c0_g1_i1::g.40345::m.40345/K03363/CDC20; cell division cycle 20, cofactor of APC complex